MAKIPEELWEKIYMYAHPSLGEEATKYIKLQSQIHERKSFMVKYCWLLFENFVRGTSLKDELTVDEIEATIHILSKCTCCKKYFSKKTKKIVFRCGCMHYIRTLFEVLNENSQTVERKIEMYKKTPLKDSYKNIRSWSAFEKTI